MHLNLQNKRALITGGGAGIGLAIAAKLAEEGCDVAICGRTQATLDAALAELSSKDVAERGNAIAHVVDMADEAAIGRWVAQASEVLGGIDIVVHNASGGGGAGEEAWRRNVDVDVLGFARLMEHAVPHLAISPDASVVAIASTAAIESFGNPAAPFGAMKAALTHHAAGLSKTLAGQGIRVNVVSPGPIFVEGGAWDTVREQRPELYDSVVGQIPRGQMGSADEVAGIVAFIASPVAALITGANVVADGGLTKRIPI